MGLIFFFYVFFSSGLDHVGYSTRIFKLDSSLWQSLGLAHCTLQDFLSIRTLDRS